MSTRSKYYRLFNLKHWADLHGHSLDLQVDKFEGTYDSWPGWEVKVGVYLQALDSYHWESYKIYDLEEVLQLMEVLSMDPTSSAESLH